jgi:hypothetical protein
MRSTMRRPGGLVVREIGALDGGRVGAGMLGALALELRVGRGVRTPGAGIGERVIGGPGADESVGVPVAGVGALGRSKPVSSGQPGHGRPDRSGTGNADRSMGRDERSNGSSGSGRLSPGRSGS